MYSPFYSQSAMILYIVGKKCFFNQLCHMSNTEVAVPQFGHYAKNALQPRADPGGLCLTCKRLRLMGNGVF